MPGDSGLAQVLPRLTGLEKLEISFVPKTIDGGSRLSFMMRNGVVRVDDQATLLLNQNTVAIFPILSTLPKLKGLNLDGGNNRMVFPDGIFEGLTQLDTLEITNFKIGQILKALCALSGLRFLNLNQNRLTELPACIGQLQQLEILKVEYDSLKTVPESLAELSHLTHLHLSANQLQVLPETIGRLTALQELKLTDNELSVLPVALGQLKQLETLEIKSNQLTVLPDLGQLANLRSLNVFDNQLTTLPASLTRLSKLRTLVVLGNRLTKLPVDIGNLKRLHTLIIDQNNLTALPESIGKLDSLQRLLIGENQLRQLPEGLLKLRNLRELYIGKNQLISLPANIGALRNLESFNLADNPLTELPESVGDWTKLKAATIQFTKIRLLPTSIGKWSSVTSINVDNNELMALPNEIGQCQQLSRLSVRNANLLGLPASIGKLQQLKELIITGKTDEQRGNTAIGEIQKLPDSLAFCSQLTNLRINHQRELDTWSLYQLLPMLKSLRELDLTDCGITDISSVAWYQLPLQRLSLGKNKLMQVPINLASGPAISWIDLSDNPLPAIFNQPFGNMEQLRTRLVELAITAGTLPNHMPDAQLMRTFLAQARQRMEQHLLPEYILADIDRAAQFAPDSLAALPEAQRAEVYLMHRDYAKAITYYENALAKASLLPVELVENAFMIPTKTKTVSQVGRWWGNKGVAYGELGQYDKALSALQKGLELLNGQEQTTVAGPLLVAEGRFLAMTQKHKEAQVSFLKAIAAFQQNDQRAIFAPRRFIRRSSGNAMVFLDAESLMQQLTIAALGLVTGKLDMTERELTHIASTYTPSEIGVYGLVLNYLRACQAVVEGRKTTVQAKDEFKNVLSERKMEAEGWSFAWLEAAFSTMSVSAEKKDALRQLTAMAKEGLKPGP